MKRFLFPLIAVLGFVAGWNLPKDELAPSASSAPVSGEDPRRELKRRALMKTLLSDEELEAYRMRLAPIAEVLVSMRGKRHMQEGGGNEEDEEVSRLMELGPAASMDAMLANPITDPDHLLTLAIAWAEKQPEEALRYLRGRKQSYVVQDCIEAVLAMQAKPEEEKEEPSSEQADASPGPEEKAGPEAPADPPAPEPPAPKKSVTWDPATYDGDDHDQHMAMLDDFSSKPDETIARIGERGSHALREEVMTQITNYSIDTGSWPEATQKLETAIQQLGVIPEDPPRSFEIGPRGLDGSQVSSWVDSQPLALRRAWSPAIVDQWAQVDPRAALAWADALPENASRNQAIQTGLIVWTHRDPSAAIAYVDAMPEGDLREISISNAAATWKCIDPTAAKKWVDALPDSPGKQRALERLKQ